MSDHTPSFSITPPQIVPLAAGDSPQARSNAQGHLFERFMARVFEAYGCDTPRVDSLNVRSNGYELDLSMRIIISSAEAIAECKAYTSNISSPALTSFYGKLTTERFDRKGLSGWFVAIPGLTPDAFELARKLETIDLVVKNGYERSKRESGLA